MARHPDNPQKRGRQAVEVDGIPIATVLNENWRGKSDAQERRRIQNRLNQRAFRQRKRSGEPSKLYKQRSSPEGKMKSKSPGGENDDEKVTDDDEDPGIPSARFFQSGEDAGGRSRFTPRSGVTSTVDHYSGRERDELAQLINCNLHVAAAGNARHLGLDLDALRNATSVCTPRTTTQQNAPATLRPIEAQHIVAHDPIIDTIPHAGLRYNILRAIAQQQLDPVAFSTDLRQSGALEEVNGCWRRGGLVVWSSPEEIASWEISEPFASRWGFLLEGCDDLIAATNEWRSQRAEKLFPATLSARRIGFSSSS